MKLARKLRSEMSLPEGLLWRQLRLRPGGFKFRRQHPAGRYVLDFYCAAARLAIEVDGFAHDTAETMRRDGTRSAFLRSQGIATLRVPAKIVLEDRERAITRIVEVCRERCENSRVPLHHPADGGVARQGREEPRVPLHHPADGPPPPVGEE